MKHIYFSISCSIILSCNPSGNDRGQGDTHYNNSSIPQAVPDSLGKLAETRQVVQDDFLIVPGECAGRTSLGITTDSLEILLGKPDASDAAMGKAWLTWYGKRDEHNNRTRLDIYTGYKDSTMMEKIVREVHVTSPSFHTEDDLRVYSSMLNIRKHFPDLKKVVRYRSGGRDITICDDQNQGIAFEQVTINGEDICTGIFVHKQNVPVTETYIYLEPGAKLIR